MGGCFPLFSGVIATGTAKMIFEKNALVVDDHKLVCDSLATLVQVTAVVQHVFTAYVGNEALQILKGNRVAVALIDVRMPDMSGIQLIKTVRAEYPSVKVLGMTSFEEPLTVHELARSGVDGIKMKSSTDREEIKLALQRLLDNQTYFTPAAEQYLKSEPDAPAKLPSLTPRELELVKLLCTGRSTNAIAALLALAPSTVADYRKHLLEKASVKNVAELVSYAHRNGLV